MGCVRGGSIDPVAGNNLYLFVEFAAFTLPCLLQKLFITFSDYKMLNILSQEFCTDLKIILQSF